MTDAEAVAVPADALGLLEGAIGYALGAVRAVTPQLLSGPTPCADWDLRTLLHHLNDALDVLGEGIDTGRIGPYPAGGGPDAIPETATIDVVYGLHAKTLGLPAAEFQAVAEGMTHRRRLPTLAEVANAAAFIASDQASAITGTVVNLSGGTLVD